MIKTEIIDKSQELTKDSKQELEHFAQSVVEIIGRQDYGLKRFESICFFIEVVESGKNELNIECETELSHEEKIGFSLMCSRIQFLIEKTKGDFKNNLDFYITTNEKDAEKVRKVLNGEAKIQSITQNNKNGKNIEPLLLEAKNPRFKMEQIELDKKAEKALKEAIILIQKRGIIYDDWGFREIDEIPKTIINFYGKPGTGKTMSAHIIASELGKKIISANYSDIESKYVGDAPKNLVKAFDLAEKQDAILFFDEADSFLSKRITNVAQSADQAANSLRSELLKLLEERPIIVIFATNLQENYDKAFHSRILRSIEFKLPKKNLRKRIILRLIPKKLYEKGMVEFDDEQLNALSSLTKGYGGREIKNAVLRALNMAVMDEVLPSFEIFKEAFKKAKKDFDKNHKEVKRKDTLGKKIGKNLKSKNYKKVRRK
ncbi:AAA family ATPase [Helicobacter brantae]|uniref:AAA family ATPase n=1 Tax=Helicobacter brantae TaxID=375927 RepID=A0A3D8J2Y1_9HELI|nr:AAA family ATPase [Helicobacter brantae]